MCVNMVFGKENIYKNGLSYRSKNSSLDDILYVWFCLFVILLYVEF